jgi:hypothetical protein
MVLALVKNVFFVCFGDRFLHYFGKKKLFLTHAKDFCGKRALICLILKHLKTKVTRFLK